MPARSRTQQRLFGQALALKRGEIKRSDLDPRWAQEIANLADSMSIKKLKDFAETKHKNLPEKVKETKILDFIGFINEELDNNSLYFIKESYPPHPFHIESERKFNLIKSDLEDILLEISDSTMRINIHKYIDDIIFEIQIYISEIETKEDKKLVEECILRISSFLEDHNLSIFKVNMIQNIDGENHEFDFYDLSEIENLDNSAGTIKLEIVFGEHPED